MPQGLILGPLHFFVFFTLLPFFETKTFQDNLNVTTVCFLTLLVHLCVSSQCVKLPLSKDVGQPLTASIVPSHLAAVAAAAAAFPLRPSHNPSLFQTQSLPTPLLRPAPGPIRTSHAPVLFAPYWPLNCDFGLSLTHHPGANFTCGPVVWIIAFSFFFFPHRHTRILIRISWVILYRNN